MEKGDDCFLCSIKSGPPGFLRKTDMILNPIPDIPNGPADYAIQRELPVKKGQAGVLSALSRCLFPVNPGYLPAQNIAVAPVQDPGRYRVDSYLGPIETKTGGFSVNFFQKGSSGFYSGQESRRNPFKDDGLFPVPEFVAGRTESDPGGRQWPISGPVR
jgi:hypothetical protein